MRRKLVKQGPASLTVSLPAPWVKANKLTAGRDVDLTIDRNKIIIATDAPPVEDNSVSLDVRSLSTTFIGQLLNSLHKRGAEEIRLLAEKNQFAAIEERVNKNLLGYEIVRQTADSMVIRFVTKIDSEELPVLIRRTFLVTIALAEGVANHTESAHEVLVLEETNNRLTNYCERIIIRHAVERTDAIFEYIIVWLLEKLADAYKDIVIKGKIDKQEAREALILIKQFYDIYYKYSLERHDSYLLALRERIEQADKIGSAFSTVFAILSQATGSLIAMHVQ